MDAVDRQILQLLQKDSNLTHKQVAGLLDLSVTPVYERIKRLERTGVIEKYVALVNPEKINKTLVAYTNISLKEHSIKYLKQFEAEIQTVKEVTECYHIAGQFDYMLKIIISDMQEYQQVVMEKLAKMDNIANVQSSFVMTEIKKSTELPID